MDNQQIEQIISSAQSMCQSLFSRFEQIAQANSERVIRAFELERISTAHFSPTTGYGYGDSGREKLARVFARAFETEAAVVSPYISGGTHAIALMLGAVLRPNDKVLSITGKPYDTLEEVMTGAGVGGFADFNIGFSCVELNGGKIDIEAAKSAVERLRPRVVFIQRSRGYTMRGSLCVAEILAAARAVKAACPSVIVAVDNCYGEFVEDCEPTAAEVDLIAGSLIKNAGGGIAPTGGYVAGKSELIRQVEYRLTVPSIGAEVGSYAFGYQAFFMGLFLAPHVVRQALMASALLGAVFSSLGFQTVPKANEMPFCIIRSVVFNDEKKLINAIKAVQNSGAIDSFVECEPWDMPGYKHKVIMAAPTFVSGSSIELSADAPIKPPFVGHFQGALTYEHAKYAIKKIISII